MIFLDKIQKLLAKYENHPCATRDKAFLYGVCNSKPPIANHIVFEPMSEGDIKKLIADYKRDIPKELLTLYRFMNGADLFWTVRVVGKNRQIPISQLSIYGVPLTFDRMHLEPFNIRIEDLNRPDNTPDSWLKFGSYYRPKITDIRLDLFVDTETFVVYAVKNGSSKCQIERTWISIDYCLCCLMDEQINDGV